jgi:hypothetical protein
MRLHRSEAARAGSVPASGNDSMLPADPSLEVSLHGVRDSKLMTPAQREAWAPRIQEAALARCVEFASAGEIDALGILPSTKLAAQRAFETLNPDYLLTDYLGIPRNPPLPDGSGQRRPAQPERRGGLGPCKNRPGCQDAQPGLRLRVKPGTRATARPSCENQASFLTVGVRVGGGG